MEIEHLNVIDAKKLGTSIHEALDAQMALLKREKFSPSDNSKIRLLRNMNGTFNAALGLVQQQTARYRAAIIVERMKQLGFGSENDRKQLEG